ncbi:hypothetical protein [Rhodoferax mekongensis]|uniref:Alanine dehydrogenase/pyridine nucleotide transhydrogenase N-terminal domain-containing protein n=1 Tax=Rhodoferax mekongensis TaxID=3068341 RepID=A0ABZ0B259_9BURK|nr:hypothetical protein [Rhodoferax sp. TBRC 17307]WNO05976.1 hypothetical protein RAN89_05990 [Rhodoferax sp. TBRC 17307]
MATRIYKATTPKGVRLIDAGIKSSVIAHVARDEIKVEVASGHDIAELVGAGVKVEVIGANANQDLFVEGTQQ